MGLSDHALNAAVSQLFKHYDKDESGSLDASELQSMVQFLSETAGFDLPANDFIIKRALKAIDKDENGEVSKEELKQVVNWIHDHAGSAQEQ